MSLRSHFDRSLRLPRPKDLVLRSSNTTSGWDRSEISSPRRRTQGSEMPLPRTGEVGRRFWAGNPPEPYQVLVSIVQTDVQNLANGRRAYRPGRQIDGKPTCSPPRNRKKGRIVLAFEHRRESKGPVHGLRPRLGEDFQIGVFHQGKQ